MVDRASEVTGLDLPRLMVEGCEQELADPAVAQVSVYTLSVATASLLSDAGCEPWAVAGHSLGEYGALVVAGCLDWEIALRFVARRGRCMARAGREKPGAMAAILGLPPETVEKLCDRTADGEEVGLANHNAPTQVVVAGSTDAVGHLMEAACEAGATDAKLLPVAGAFHSPLMADAEEELADAVDELPLHPPRRIFVSSATGKAVTDVESYRKTLRCQITKPVLWRKTMATLAAAGATRFVEVGPGKVLRGLTKSNGYRSKAANVATWADYGTLLAS